MPLAVRECTTHHHACDCREAKFAAFVEAADICCELTRYIPLDTGREISMNKRHEQAHAAREVYEKAKAEL